MISFDITAVQPAGWAILAFLAGMFVLARVLKEWYSRVVGSIVIAAIVLALLSGVSDGTVKAQELPMYLAALVVITAAILSLMFPQKKVVVPVVSNLSSDTRAVLSLIIIIGAIVIGAVLKLNDGSLTSQINSNVSAPVIRQTQRQQVAPQIRVTPTTPPKR